MSTNTSEQAEKKGKWSFLTVILLSAIIIVCSFRHNQVSKACSNVITWDVYGYYLYLPAVFIYHDTRNYDFATQQLEKYKVSSTLYQLNHIDDKLLAPGYTMGLAILWLPFFIIAHAFAVITQTYAADGLSFPYQLAVIVASWFYAVTGLWFLRKALLKFFTDDITAVTIAGIVLGTNYFHYACFESGMPHAVLFSLYALLFSLVVSWYMKPAKLLSISIGIVIALACLARPSEIVIALFFFLYSVKDKKSAIRNVHYLWDNRPHILLVILSAILIILPQILYWHFNIGRWFYNGYEGHTFSFLHPHFANGLFSYRKGWLLYTPLMVLALLGFFTRHIRYAGLLFPVLGYFLLSVYIIFSWDIWWYASSFGARGMVQSYALLSIPLASFLVSTKTYGWPPVRMPVYLLLMLCITLNQFQDWQYRHGVLPKDETNGIYYRKIFGRTHIADKQIKRFLDVEEELPKGKTFSPVLLNDSGADSIQSNIFKNSFGKQVVVPVTDSNRYALSCKWIRVQADMLCTDNQFYQWHEAMLVFSVQRNGKALKWTSVKFQRFVEPGQWATVNYDTQLPTLQSGDQLVEFIWNQGPDSILYRCVKLQLMKEAD